MKQEVARSPSLPLEEVKEMVLRRELHGKISDEEKVAEVVAALPVKIESTLYHFRHSLIGKTRKKRTS